MACWSSRSEAVRGADGAVPGDHLSAVCLVPLEYDLTLVIQDAHGDRLRRKRNACGGDERFNGRLQEHPMQSLEQQFTQAMFDIYRRAKTEAGYNATIFLQMISDRGGVDTAKKLINASKPSDGYTHLYERGYLK